MKHILIISLIVGALIGVGFIPFNPGCEAKQCNLDSCYTSSNCGPYCSCVKVGTDLMGTCVLVD